MFYVLAGSMDALMATQSFDSSKLSPLSVVNYHGSRHVATKTRPSKVCVVCRYNNVKTRKGWRVYTSDKCSNCDVPLCTGPRECFWKFHNLGEQEKLKVLAAPPVPYIQTGTSSDSSASYGELTKPYSGDNTDNPYL